MTITESNLKCDEIYATLRRRFRELQLLTWKCDSTGRVIHSPDEQGILWQWCRADEIIAIIEEASTSALIGTATTGELFPGCEFVCLLDKQGLRSTGATIALSFGELAVRCPEFEKICISAGLDSAQCREAIKPLLRQGGRNLQELSAILTWTHQDIWQSDRDKRTLSQCGERLLQAYEETHLLFRLARFLNCVGDPQQVIQSICDQMRLILPFPWLAIKFTAECRHVPQLAGKLLASGELPGEAAIFNQTVDSLLARWDADDWTHRLLPHESELAREAGTEVLAEPITHDGRVIGALLAGSHPGVGSPEMQFIDAAADFIGIFHENLARFDEQRSLFMGSLRALTSAIDAKDRYTCGHSERVAFLAAQMVQAAGLDEKLTERYRIAGIVHDVGKIGVPEAVLCKVGRLTDQEFAEIKLHPETGYRILKDIPDIADILPGVMHHHERYDGRGYPHGLKGEEIPLIARVLALADTFDAMSSTRSYRAAIGREQVLAEIRKCAGTQFDPELAQVFVKMDFSGFDALLDRHKTVSAAA